MAPEISPMVAGVRKEILEAARLQSPESIDHAVRSFQSISGKQGFSEIPTSSVAEKGTSPAGFVAPPTDYLVEANQASGGDLVPLDQLIAGLRSQGSRIQKGLESFLQTGIQESLSSLKLRTGPRSSSPEILEPLNDLLSANQMKNLNASKLQPSIDAVNEMYSALRKVQNAATHLELSRLRMIRA